MSYEALDQIADLYNPLLLLAALILTTLSCRGSQAPYTNWLKRIVLVGCGLALVYGVQYLDHRLQLWPRLGWDYSTHTAFAMAMVWPLWYYGRPPWRWVWPTSLVIYGVLMLYQRYHTLADMVSTAIVIFGLLLGLYRTTRLLPGTTKVGTLSVRQD